MDTGFWAGVFGIAAAVVGLAMAATLVKNASGTAQIANAGFSGFSQVLTAAEGNAV